MSDGRVHDFTKVNFGQMELAQEGLLKVVSELDRLTDQLYKDVQKELADHWLDSGSGAKSMFDTERANWDIAEKQMGDDLHKAAQAVGLANENYKAAEDFNRKLWSDPGR